MTPELWVQVKEVFQEALALDGAARARYLDDACIGDEAMRDEVESLLEAYDGAEDFMGGDEGLTPAIPSGSPWPRACPRCGARFGTRDIVCPEDGEVLVDDPHALAGTTLDGLYHVEQLLGEGGFGTVYLASHTLLRDRVAVKILKRDLTANPDLLRRFLREGRAARSIRHPNIVATHDLRISPEGFAYMVMEYVPGRTLRQLLDEAGSVTVDRALEVLEPIAGALDAAHAQGVVHRDLKPENIAIDVTEKTAKLLDLGLAKLREMATGGEDSTLTLPGQRLGTPRYMSPEQWGEPARDGTREIDGRADVYSLAVIAYEMVAGRPPFAGPTAWDVRREHLEAELVPLEGTSRPFARAVARALSKDRADRPATAGAFLAEARAADERPHSRLGAVALAIVLALVVVLAFALTQTSVWHADPIEPGTAAPASVVPSASATAPAETRRYLALSDDERFAFVDARAREISRRLSGRDYVIPPSARVGIKRYVDRYAARVGTGNRRPPREDLLFVMERARAFAPTFASAFRDMGVSPLIGIYLPMIESEYTATATSSIGARGPFQVMPQTAARYGVAPDALEEPATAARVAALYVRDQMADFGDDRMSVALAIAAYNRGPRGIERYLQDVKVLNDEEAELRFWELLGSRDERYFNENNSPEYVYQFLAAAVVGENPQAFGIGTRALSSY